MRFAAEQLSGPYISAAGRFKVRPAICTNIKICRTDSCDRVAAYYFNQSQVFRCLLKSIPKLKASSKTELQRNDVLERKSESSTGPSYQQRRFQLYSFPSFGIQLATGSMRLPINAVYSKTFCPLRQRRPTEGLFLPFTELRSRMVGSIFPVKALSSSNPDPVSSDPPSKDTASTATRDLETAKSTVASRVGQNVNMRGIGVFLKLVFGGDSHLAVPHISVPDIRWIDWEALKAAGFRGVVFDKDNTLTEPYTHKISPDLLQPFQECRNAFDGQIAILSNSAGLRQFDPQGVKAAALEEQLQIPVIRHGQKKPGGNAEDLAAHFGCEALQLIMVGDRYLTDVVYGNRNGLLTVRCAPLAQEKDPLVVRQVRKLEDMMLLRWQAQRARPVPHPLAPIPLRFLRDPGCW